VTLDTFAGLAGSNGMRRARWRRAPSRSISPSSRRCRVASMPLSAIFHWATRARTRLPCATWSALIFRTLGAGGAGRSQAFAALNPGGGSARPRDRAGGDPV